MSGILLCSNSVAGRKVRTIAYDIKIASYLILQCFYFPALQWEFICTLLLWIVTINHEFNLIICEYSWSACGGCARGFKRADNFACEPCDEDLGLYDWLYLGFMAILPLLLHFTFTDRKVLKWAYNYFKIGHPLLLFISNTFFTWNFSEVVKTQSGW